MRRMIIKATATTTMMNVPKGVARSMALSQNSVALVELVGVTGDLEGATEIEKKNRGRNGCVASGVLSCNAYCTLYLKDFKAAE